MKRWSVLLLLIGTLPTSQGQEVPFRSRLLGNVPQKLGVGPHVFYKIIEGKGIIRKDL